MVTWKRIVFQNLSDKYLGKEKAMWEQLYSYILTPRDSAARPHLLPQYFSNIATPDAADFTSEN
jgi:hypothetical protein